MQNFSPFQYSSGESTVATSDAQEVDYGTSVDAQMKGIPYDGGSDDNKTNVQTVNRTQRTGVSDFGSVWYPYLKHPKLKKEKGIPAAVQLTAKGVPTNSGFAYGSPSGGGMANKTPYPADAVSMIQGNGVMDQRENVVTREFFGQLGG